MKHKNIIQKGKASFFMRLLNKVNINSVATSNSNLNPEQNVVFQRPLT